MRHGELIGIFIAAHKAGPLHALERIEAVAGRGLAGDRYFLQEDAPSAKHAPDREVTLIESEALEGLAREYGITLSAVQARRNLLTRGVALNHLIERTFSVGPVVLRGIQLCEPCGHLEKLTQKGVRKGLIHRGGLRAQIVHGGMLQLGDVVKLREGTQDG